jgi:uncharacterized protein
MTGALVESSAAGSALWRRLDQPGHDACRIELRGDDWRLRGSAVLAEGGRPARLDYIVDCDARWRTRSCRISGWLGPAAVEIELTVDSDRRWRMNGAERPEVRGCVDVDLGFTPATNTLAIRRLDLAVGQEEDVRSAWLSWPELRVAPLSQRYRRTGASTYHYESPAHGFTAELVVSGDGLVAHYPGLWAAEVAAEATPSLSYRSPKTEVRESAIHGRGLFAREAIARGELVVVKGGYVFDTATLRELEKSLGPAEIPVADGLYIGPVARWERDGGMIWSNHSCDPNIGVQGQIAFVAMRDIGAGEELTHDWATTDDDTYEMRCRCGAARCRGLITGQDWRRPDLQDKYRGYIAWYLLRKIDRGR